MTFLVFFDWHGNGVERRFPLERDLTVDGLEGDALIGTVGSDAHEYEWLPSFLNDMGDGATPSTTYDPNGNILSMDQKGLL